jgi:hypothetical protein
MRVATTPHLAKIRLVSAQDSVYSRTSSAIVGSL